jgi:hypothetical protein
MLKIIFLGLHTKELIALKRDQHKTKYMIRNGTNLEAMKM